MCIDPLFIVDSESRAWTVHNRHPKALAPYGIRASDRMPNGRIA